MRLTTPRTPDPLNLPCRKHVGGKEERGKKKQEGREKNGASGGSVTWAELEYITTYTFFFITLENIPTC